MRAEPERLRYFFLKLQFYSQRGFAFGQPGAIADSKDMGIDRKSLSPKGAVHHHIGGLASDARQRSEQIAVGRNHSAMIAHE